MKVPGKGNKKSNLLSAGSIIPLAGIHIFTAFLLNSHYKDTAHICEGSGAFIHFHPEINSAGSFLNLKLGMEYNELLFMLLIVCGFLAAGMLLIYIIFLNDFYGAGTWTLISPILFMSASVGRLAERLIWEYTFDFIAVKNVGILDMCDVYLLGGCAVLLITAAYFQNCETKKMRGLGREEKKTFRRELNKQFWKNLR